MDSISLANYTPIGDDQIISSIDIIRGKIDRVINQTKKDGIFETTVKYDEKGEMIKEEGNEFCTYLDKLTEIGKQLKTLSETYSYYASQKDNLYTKNYKITNDPNTPGGYAPFIRENCLLGTVREMGQQADEVFKSFSELKAGLNQKSTEDESEFATFAKHVGNIISEGDNMENLIYSFEEIRSSIAKDDKNKMVFNDKTQGFRLGEFPDEYVKAKAQVLARKMIYENEKKVTIDSPSISALEKYVDKKDFEELEKQKDYGKVLSISESLVEKAALRDHIIDMREKNRRELDEYYDNKSVGLEVDLLSRIYTTVNVQQNPYGKLEIVQKEGSVIDEDLRQLKEAYGELTGQNGNTKTSLASELSVFSDYEIVDPLKLDSKEAVEECRKKLGELNTQLYKKSLDLLNESRKYDEIIEANLKAEKDFENEHERKLSDLNSLKEIGRKVGKFEVKDGKYIQLEQAETDRLSKMNSESFTTFKQLNDSLANGLKTKDANVSKLAGSIGKVKDIMDKYKTNNLFNLFGAFNSNIIDKINTEDREFYKSLKLEEIRKEINATQKKISDRMKEEKQFFKIGNKATIAQLENMQRDFKLISTQMQEVGEGMAQLVAQDGAIEFMTQRSRDIVKEYIDETEKSINDEYQTGKKKFKMLNTDEKENNLLQKQAKADLSGNVEETREKLKKIYDMLDLRDKYLGDLYVKDNFEAELAKEKKDLFDEVQRRKEGLILKKADVMGSAFYEKLSDETKDYFNQKVKENVMDYDEFFNGEQYLDTAELKGLQNGVNYYLSKCENHKQNLAAKENAFENAKTDLSTHKEINKELYSRLDAERKDAQIDNLKNYINSSGFDNFKSGSRSKTFKELCSSVEAFVNSGNTANKDDLLKNLKTKCNEYMDAKKNEFFSHGARRKTEKGRQRFDFAFEIESFIGDIEKGQKMTEENRSKIDKNYGDFMKKLELTSFKEMSENKKEWETHAVGKSVSKEFTNTL